jgi:hypothetical protein
LVDVKTICPQGKWLAKSKVNTDSGLTPRWSHLLCWKLLVVSAIKFIGWSKWWSSPFGLSVSKVHKDFVSMCSWSHQIDWILGWVEAEQSNPTLGTVSKRRL